MTNRARLVLPAAAAAAVAAAALSGCQPTGSDGPAKIAACVKAHHLTSAHQVTSGTRKVGTVPYPVVTVRSCTWPPAKSAAQDGYTAITDNTRPGPGAAEASGETLAHVVSGPCRSYAVTWRYSNMGGTGVGRSTAAGGRIWRFSPTGARTGVWPLAPAVDTHIRPTVNEAVILTNFSYMITDARCA